MCVIVSLNSFQPYHFFQKPVYDLQICIADQKVTFSPANRVLACEHKALSTMSRTDVRESDMAVRLVQADGFLRLIGLRCPT